MSFFDFPTPSVTPPTIGSRINVVLTFPFFSPTTTLTLPNPEFGDIHNIDMTQINRQTRNNDLIVYRDPIWPRLEKLNLRWAYLTGQQGNDLLGFYFASFGKVVGFKDWFDRQWQGLIINPSSDFTQPIDRGCGAVTAILEFEGELL